MAHSPTQENGPVAMTTWLKLLALLCAGAASNSIYLCFSSVGIEASQKLGVSLLEVNSLAALGNVATFAGYPFAAVVIDQFGIAPAFAAGTIVSVFGCSLRVFSASIHNFPLFAMGQFLVNFGSTFYNILPPAFAIRQFPAGLQGLAVGIGEFGVMAGQYGGPALGAAFRADPGQLLWVQLAATVLALPMIPFFFSGSSTTAQTSVAESGSFHLRVVRCFSIRGMFALLFGFSLSNSLFSAFASALEELGVALPGVDLNLQLTSIMTVTAVLGALLAGPVADKVGIKKALSGGAILGLFGWIVCFIGMKFAVPLALEMGWALVACLHGGAVPTLSYMLASEAAPGIEGTVCACLNMAASGLCIMLQSETAKLLSDSSLHMALPCIATWTTAAAVATLPLLHSAAIMKFIEPIKATDGERELLLKKNRSVLG